MKTWQSALMIVVLAAGTVSGHAGTFDAWNYRMKVSFTNYTRPEALTNFPALVVLSTNIPRFRYSGFTSSSGSDLRFASSNEATELNYEIERWDTNGASYVWV